MAVPWGRLRSVALVEIHLEMPTAKTQSAPKRLGRHLNVKGKIRSPLTGAGVRIGLRQHRCKHSDHTTIGTGLPARGHAC